MISVGVLVSFVSGYFLSEVEHGWRVASRCPASWPWPSLYVCAPSPIVQWLLEKNNLRKRRMHFPRCMGTDSTNDHAIRQRRFRRSGGNITSEAPKASTSSNENPLVSGTEDQFKAVQTEAHMRSKSDEVPDDVALYCRLRRQSRQHDGEVAHEGSEDSQRGYLQGLSSNFQQLWPWRYPLCIVLLLQAASQLGGGVVIRNYADVLFQMNGASESSALDFTLSLAFVKLLFTYHNLYSDTTVGR